MNTRCQSGAFAGARPLNAPRPLDVVMNRHGEPVALRKLGWLLTGATTDYAAWDELGRALDRRRHLVESERRLVEMQQVITAERAMVLLGVVVDTIKRHVTDRAALAAISADLRRVAEFQVSAN